MKTNSLLLLLLVAACGGGNTTPPPAGTGSFSLEAPATLQASPGASAVLDVVVKRKEGYAKKVTLTASAPGLTATVTETRVKLDVPAATRGKVPVKVVGTGEDGETAEANVELDVLEPFKGPSKQVDIHVKLNALFYASGDQARVVVDFGAASPATVPDVVLVSSESHDSEKLTLTRTTGNQFESNALTVTTAEGPGTAMDGTFTLPAGGVFFAFVPIDRTWPGFESVEVAMVSDFAFADGEREGNPKSRVEPMLALTADETMVPQGGRPVGTILRVGSGPGAGVPVQVATEELILFHADDAELNRFLQASGGQKGVTQEVDGDKPFATLVKVDPTKLSPARIALLRGLLKDDGELVASKSDAQGIYGLALAYRLDGFIVSVNPRLQYQGVPTVAEPERSNLRASMRMVGRSGSSAQCVPGDVTRRCALDAPALWAYLDLLELDSRRVKVAVLDMGFAPNADFRTNADGSIDQCDMTGGMQRCGPGTALGAPTVGASLVGPRVWHGTGVVTALGGIVDNGFGGAGTGGQVAVPMLYKYDLASYAFDMGRGIRHAVSNGAQVVNISAGYPCTAVMNVGPDFDYCSVEGRVGICAVVTLAAHTAAVAFCTSPAAGIPIGGAIACGALSIAAVVATDACLSTLYLGNVRDPMRSAVAYATSRGVPVVASAGNVLSADSFPEPLRTLVNFSEHRTERWGIVPATLPDVICAGAVNADGDLANSQFHGDRIDVWAPERTMFTGPSSADDPASPLSNTSIGGTSAAAPYISGVIAAMQAVNPSLDPTRASAADRLTIVRRTRDILRNTALTNTDLAALGWANDPRRRNLIDPLAAVLEASRGVTPDFIALGYELKLNFDEADFADDTEAGARTVTFGMATPGTAFAFDPMAPDRDWKTFTMPAMAGRVFGADVTLTWVGDEEPGLFTSSGPAIPRVSSGGSGDERTSTYRIVRSSGEAVRFAVTSRGGEDVLYKLTVSMPEALAPTLSITEPVVPMGATLCADRPTQFRATAVYPHSTATVSAVEWLIDGTLQATTSLTPVFTRPAGTDVFTVRAFGATADLTVTFVTCTVSVDIVTPAMNIMQYFTVQDATGRYLPVSFSAQARDAMGNLINPSTLVFEWSTNRADAQPGGPTSGSQSLGTGASLTNVPIYVRAGEVVDTHVITVTVRATAGGPILSQDSITVSVQNLI
ncbi:MAG: S8/S53 family peptidase [Myxococcaceae bacterium]|nr:S8/S53 family peptidase [Myxococcaceae bacterium]